MNKDRLITELTVDEGKRRHAYYDSKGILTIGIGRNVDADHGGAGLSDEEINFMLGNDILEREQALQKLLPYWFRLPDVAQEVLLNMSFMGVIKLMGFKRMLGHIRDGEWLLAADELLNSKYAQDVGKRAERLAEKLRSLA